MKILIYGSTYLTAKTCELLLDNHYDLVGYVPSHRRITVPGTMPVPVAPEDAPHDMILSIQYDRKIKQLERTFNVHTGLLPEWGGVDILYHTLKNKHHEQGITFHQMTESLDYGPILSKITYPVFSEDTIETLYERLALLCPPFVLSSLRLLERIGFDRVAQCPKAKPTLYGSHQIAEQDRALYEQTKRLLREAYGASSC